MDKKKKTKNSQIGQKIKLYGTLTTKEIKKKHSSRPVGGMKTGSQEERTCSKAVVDRPSKVADCGAGWAKMQLPSEAAAGGLGDRLHNPGLRQQGENLPAS